MAQKHPKPATGKSKAKKGSALTVQLVLDRSASMRACKAETISAFNHYVDSLRKEAPKSVLSLMQFDSQGIDSTDFLPIGKVAHLNDETFVPRSFTPLLDAIGNGVARLDGQSGERKVLVILTDGHENASREFSKAAIKALLDEREKQDWLIIYLGANQDAIAVGSQLGAQVSNTMTFDTCNVGNAMDAVTRSTTAYACAANLAEGKMASAFTTEERVAALDKKAEPGIRRRRVIVDIVDPK